MRNASPHMRIFLYYSPYAYGDSIRGPVSGVALTRQRSTAESRMNQNFLVASAHTSHQKTGIDLERSSRRPVVRRPLLLLAVVVRHVNHCPRPRALVRPRPLALAGLALALAPSSPSPVSTSPLAAAVDDDRYRLTTTTIAAATHSTTTTARSCSSSRAAMAVIFECGGGRWLRRQWRLCRRCQRRRSAPSAPSHHRLPNNDHAAPWAQIPICIRGLHLDPCMHMGIT